jgi:tetratricopeptide (TPR) repeat protein
MLGAIGADLSVLSGFFDPPWSSPVAPLTGVAKAYVLNAVGFGLRALGRLVEAVQPLEASLDLYLADQHWGDAATGASILSELLLTLGKLDQSIEYAEQSVKHADRSEQWTVQVINRANLAGALYHAGRISEAETAFSDAEKTQGENQPEFPLLYALQGYQYCDLLLSHGKYTEVQGRAAQTLKWAVQHSLSMLTCALDHLSLGRACLLQAAYESTGDFTQAAEHLNEAVDGLRQAGIQEYIARGLLARAELYRVTKEFDEAQKDLDEAMTIATRGGMRLYEADCYLEQARLHLACGGREQARKSLAVANELIQKMGYLRRFTEVSQLAGIMK